MDTEQSNAQQNTKITTSEAQISISCQIFYITRQASRSDFVPELPRSWIILGYAPQFLRLRRGGFLSPTWGGTPAHSREESYDSDIKRNHCREDGSFGPGRGRYSLACQEHLKSEQFATVNFCHHLRKPWHLFPPPFLIHLPRQLLGYDTCFTHVAVVSLIARQFGHLPAAAVDPLPTACESNCGSSQDKRALSSDIVLRNFDGDSGSPKGRACATHFGRTRRNV